MVPKTFNLDPLIPDVYLQAFIAMNNDEFDEYVFKGGRGGAKSSEMALAGVLNVASGKGSTAFFRQYKNTLRGSCYNEAISAIAHLELEDDFVAIVSPMEIRHKRNGLVISFAGLDDPHKVRSLKSKIGQYTMGIFDEAQQIRNYAVIQSVQQTLTRGGQHCNILIGYNPPSSALSWLNKILGVPREGRLITHVNYTDVPKEWLGDQFHKIAARDKDHDEDTYANVYLGEIRGAKGSIFKNVRILPPDMEFDQSYVFRGIDFGFTTDPTCYTVWAYDRKLEAIFLLYELYAHGMELETLAADIKARKEDGMAILCDNAEPRSIQTLYGLGITGARKCRKGKDSVHHGIKFLQSLKVIYVPEMINGKPCMTYKEFIQYEYPIDKITGEYLNQYPDADNHSLDSTRYSLEDLIQGYIR